MLSHELRNPLGAIVTATALLKADERAAARSAAARRRSSSASPQQMARLLDDLLEASRVTQNKIELRNGASIDLAPVAKDAADAVRSLMESREAFSFSVEIDRAEPLCGRRRSGAAPADPGQSPDQRGEVHAARRPRLARGRGARAGHAIIRVQRRRRRHSGGDARIGLRTVRAVETTLDRSEGGLGVGLTLVRSLVQHARRHGDRDERGEGKGSEFVVRLPLTTDAPETMTPRLRTRVRVRALPTGRQGRGRRGQRRQPRSLVRAARAGGIRVRHRRKRPAALSSSTGFRPRLRFSTWDSRDGWLRAGRRAVA